MALMPHTPDRSYRDVAKIMGVSEMTIRKEEGTALVKLYNGLVAYPEFQEVWNLVEDEFERIEEEKQHKCEHGSIRRKVDARPGDARGGIVNRDKVRTRNQ